MTDSKKTLLERVSASRHGATAARVLTELMSDPAFAGIFKDDQSTTAAGDDDGARAAEQIAAVLRGQTPLVHLPDACRVTFRAIADYLQFPFLPATISVPAHQEEGLPEAAIAMCDTKEQADKKMYNVRFDPPALRSKAERVVLFRNLFRPLSRFTGGLSRALLVVSDEVFTATSNLYTPFRGIAQADEELSDRLENTEDYYNGAAKKGAQSTKDNKHLKAKFQTAADQHAAIGVRRQISQGVKDDLTSLIQELGGTATLPGTTFPAGADPVGPAAGTAHRNRHK